MRIEYLLYVLRKNRNEVCHGFCLLIFITLIKLKSFSFTELLLVIIPQEFHCNFASMGTQLVPRVKQIAIVYLSPLYNASFLSRRCYFFRLSAVFQRKWQLSLMLVSTQRVQTSILSLHKSLWTFQRSLQYEKTPRLLLKVLSEN